MKIGGSLTTLQKVMIRTKRAGPTETRTQVTGIRTLGDNHLHYWTDDFHVFEVVHNHAQ